MEKFPKEICNSILNKFLAQFQNVQKSWNWDELKSMESFEFLRNTNSTHIAIRQSQRAVSLIHHFPAMKFIKLTLATLCFSAEWNHSNMMKFELTESFYWRNFTPSVPVPLFNNWARRCSTRIANDFNSTSLSRP